MENPRFLTPGLLKDVGGLSGSFICSTNDNDMLVPVRIDLCQSIWKFCERYVQGTCNVSERTVEFISPPNI